MDYQLRHNHQLAGRMVALDLAVGFGCFLQAIRVAYVYFQQPGVGQVGQVV